MLTVTNNLPSHLVIPKGTDSGTALKLGPRASAKVEKLNGPVKDAERSGLVVIQYPQASDEKSAPTKKGGKKG
jgi:hypothetical protein